MERRTMRGWFEYLDDPKREITLSEFMAQMIFNQREYARLSFELLHSMKEGSEHIEGMLGALDLAAATVAERSGLPYAASSAIRAALDEQRDSQRRISAEARREREASAS